MPIAASTNAAVASYSVLASRRVTRKHRVFHGADLAERNLRIDGRDLRAERGCTPQRMRTATARSTTARPRTTRRPADRLPTEPRGERRQGTTADDRQPASRDGVALVLDALAQRVALGRIGERGFHRRQPRGSTASSACVNASLEDRGTDHPGVSMATVRRARLPLAQFVPAMRLSCGLPRERRAQIEPQRTYSRDRRCPPENPGFRRTAAPMCRTTPSGKWSCMPSTFSRRSLDRLRRAAETLPSSLRQRAGGECLTNSDERGPPRGRGPDQTPPTMSAVLEIPFWRSTRDARIGPAPGRTALRIQRPRPRRAKSSTTAAHLHLIELMENPRWATVDESDSNDVSARPMAAPRQRSCRFRSELAVARCAADFNEVLQANILRRAMPGE